MKTIFLLYTAVIVATICPAQEKPTATPRVISLVTLQSQRERLMQERTSIEKSYESGKIDKAAYQTTIKQTIARLEKIDSDIKEAKASQYKQSRKAVDK